MRTDTSFVFNTPSLLSVVAGEQGESSESRVASRAQDRFQERARARERVSSKVPESEFEESFKKERERERFKRGFRRCVSREFQDREGESESFIDFQTFNREFEEIWRRERESEREFHESFTRVLREFHESFKSFNRVQEILQRERERARARQSSGERDIHPDFQKETSRLSDKKRDREGERETGVMME